MATVDDAKMVAGILRNNGVYGDSGGEDPQCTLIASYINDWGKEAYALCYSDGAVRSMLGSPHCHKPVVLFEGGELTEDGKEWLARH
jgi:hypothetical protein